MSETKNGDVEEDDLKGPDRDLALDSSAGPISLEDVLGLSDLDLSGWSIDGIGRVPAELSQKDPLDLGDLLPEAEGWPDPEMGEPVVEAALQAVVGDVYVIELGVVDQAGLVLEAENRPTSALPRFFTDEAGEPYIPGDMGADELRRVREAIALMEGSMDEGYVGDEPDTVDEVAEGSEVWIQKGGDAPVREIQRQRAADDFADEAVKRDQGPSTGLVDMRIIIEKMLKGIEEVRDESETLDVALGLSGEVDPLLTSSRRITARKKKAKMEKRDRRKLFGDGSEGPGEKEEAGGTPKTLQPYMFPWAGQNFARRLEVYFKQSIQQLRKGVGLILSKLFGKKL